MRKVQKEIWKDIPGNPGYQASNTGLVRSTDRIIKMLSKHGKSFSMPYKGRVLSPGITPLGYHCVHLGINGGSQLVHRVIAKTFLQNPLNKPCVNHIDFNKSNNSISNLEWVTHKENTAHAILNGRLVVCGEGGSNAKLSYNQVSYIKEQINLGLNCGEIGRNFNVSAGCIRKIKKGKNWKSHTNKIQRVNV